MQDCLFAGPLLSKSATQIHVCRTYLPGRDQNQTGPQCCHPLCQTSCGYRDESRAHKRPPHLLHPGGLSARPRLRSSLPFLSQAARRVCPGVLKWKQPPWVIVAPVLGLKQVTAPHSCLFTPSLFSTVLLTRHWCHLCNKRLKSMRRLCYGYMHNNNTCDN